MAFSLAAAAILIVSLGQLGVVAMAIFAPVPDRGPPLWVRLVTGIGLGISSGGGVGTFYAALSGESIVVPIAVYLLAQALAVWVAVAYVTWSVVGRR